MSNRKEKILEDVGYVDHKKRPEKEKKLSLAERKALASKYKKLRNEYQPEEEGDKKNGK